MDQSNLLTSAEKVVLLFHKMVENSDKDPMVAAQTLIELTMGINELGEEVNKGKNMLKQFEAMKSTIMGGGAVDELLKMNTPTGPTQDNSKPHPGIALDFGDMNKLFEQFAEALNLPKTDDKKE